MGLTCMFLLCLAVGVTHAVEPGLKARLTQKGLDYASTVGQRELLKLLTTLQIPNQSGGNGDFSWSLSNIDLSVASGPSISIALNPSQNGLTLAVSDFSASAKSNFYAKKHILFFDVDASGNVDVSVGGVSITLTVGLENNGGRPLLTANKDSCKASIPQIDLHFSGNLIADMINWFREAIANTIRGKLEPLLCDIVVNAVNEHANSFLASMKMHADVADRFLVDYSLVDAPVVTDQSLETRHKGEVSWKDTPAQYPFSPNPIPPWSETGKMVYIALTEYSAHTFAYVAHTNGYLQYNVTVSTFSSDKEYILNTTCADTDICAGTLIPELAKEHPNSLVELSVVSSAVPEVKLTNQTVTVTLAADVDVFVHKPDGNKESVLKLNVSLNLQVQPKIENNKLKGSLLNHSFEVELLQSTLKHGKPQIIKIIGFIKEAARESLINFIHDIGNQGIELMLSDKITLTNIILTLVEHNIFAECDVDFKTDRKR